MNKLTTANKARHKVMAIAHITLWAMWALNIEF